MRARLIAALVAAGLAASTAGERVRGEGEAAAVSTLDAALDAQETLIQDVDRELDPYRIAITQMTPEAVLAYFADDFEGDVPFRAALGEPSRAGEVAIRTRGPSPSKRSELRAAVEAFFGGLDLIEHNVVKIAGAVRDGDAVVATIKHRIHARAKGEAVCIIERVRARLRGGKFVRMERLEGRELRAVPAFTEVGADLGIAASPSTECHTCTYSGDFTGGIAVGDVDRDGRNDVFLAGAVRSHLWLNRGDRFEEVTERARLQGIRAAGNGALFFDHDGDGDLDLLVTRTCLDTSPGCAPLRTFNCRGRGCAVVLYRQEADGTFTNVTPDSGLESRGVATSACVADVNGDGRLDLYVGFYGVITNVILRGGAAAPDRPRPYLAARNGIANRLFLANGDGTYREAAAPAGVADTGWTLAVGFVDVDVDGRPDLYVVNDFGPSVLYRNKGEGTFEDASKRVRSTDAGFGMGLARGDFDRDGDVDLYVSRMYSSAGNRIVDTLEALGERGEHPARLRQFASGSALLRADPDGTFTDVARAAGCNVAGWAWGTVFCDYDDDGHPDLYVANGYVTSAIRAADG